MGALYRELAGVYDEIYQTLFNYDKEFIIYNNYLKKYQAQSVVEIGCGTGHLAKKMVAAGYRYIGLDLNQEMLDIAINNAPECQFMQADMRDFTLPSLYDAVLITGRSISYLTSNQDILACFKAIKVCLKPTGIFIFDVIDAFPLFNSLKGTKLKERSLDELVVSYENRQYKRLSESTPNLETGWTWDWKSTYFQLDGNDFREIGRDFATLRAFTKDEMTLFLTMSDFNLSEIVEKETYAWNDYFFVANLDY